MLKGFPQEQEMRAPSTTLPWDRGLSHCTVHPSLPGFASRHDPIKSAALGRARELNAQYQYHLRHYKWWCRCCHYHRQPCSPGCRRHRDGSRRNINMLLQGREESHAVGGGLDHPTSWPVHVWRHLYKQPISVCVPIGLLSRPRHPRFSINKRVRWPCPTSSGYRVIAIFGATSWRIRFPNSLPPTPPPPPKRWPSRALALQSGRSPATHP